MNVWLETAEDGETLLQQVPGWFEEIEAILSRFRPDSELSQLNQKSGKQINVSEILLEITRTAKYAARATKGLYNPLVLPALLAAGYDRSFEQILMKEKSRLLTKQKPARIPDWNSIKIDANKRMVRLPAHSAIDVGGIAKGWTAELVANRLAPFGACLIDAGGDLVGRGSPAGQAGWNVGIAEPDSTDSDVVSVMIKDQAIATSSTDYRRWKHGDTIQHHLIDPRSGKPAMSDVVSATVIHPHASTAEAYTKGLVFLGSRAGLDWFSRHLNISSPDNHHTAAMVVCLDGSVLATSNFESFIVQKENIT